MKTKTLKKNKVNVVTLGCSKNIFDSEVLMAQLHANNFDVEHESKEDDAEIVIINTCGFIDNAKQESIDTIIRYAAAKKDGLVKTDDVVDALAGAAYACMHETFERLPQGLLVRMGVNSMTDGVVFRGMQGIPLDSTSEQRKWSTRF